MQIPAINSKELQKYSSIDEMYKIFKYTYLFW